MLRIVFITLSLSLLMGCGKPAARMAQPEDPQGRYKEHISTAKRLLEQKETWSDRAEWEVIKTSDGWQVVAWRVEYPNAKGPKRYLPWGYSVIELDSRLVTVGYKPKG